MAQIELWIRPGDYKNEVYVLPKHLDEKVARLRLWIPLCHAPGIWIDLDV